MAIATGYQTCLDSDSAGGLFLFKGSYHFLLSSSCCGFPCIIVHENVYSLPLTISSPKLDTAAPLGDRVMQR